MTIAYRNEEMLNMVSSETGTVDRRIFSDRDIYELELERIFARAWNFMCHDTQIPNPGDFFQTVIGEDRVIVVRDNDDMPQVLVNTCRHRGNAICRADEGHATSFMCTYHGWTYDLKGALVGVPGFKEVYHEELDRENWGLIKAAQVDTYKGFIFANMDPDAPSFPEYLGDVGRMSIDSIAERGDDITILGGVQKYTIPCNWKLAADNVWDWYHGISHQSALMSAPPTDERWVFSKYGYTVVPGEYGHAIGGPDLDDVLIKEIETLAQMREQLQFGPAYQDEAYIFARADGTHLTDSQPLRAWNRICRELKTTARFHDLRHTNASLLLASGVPMKVVQERLGHGSYQVTADIYSHLIPGLELSESAAERLDALLENSFSSK